MNDWARMLEGGCSKNKNKDFGCVCSVFLRFSASISSRARLGKKPEKNLKERKGWGWMQLDLKM